MTETKRSRILRALAAGARLTRFDAERLGDHALNTTVAALGQDGVVISRDPTVIEGRFGTIHCKTYYIAPDDLHTAMRLLERT